MDTKALSLHSNKSHSLYEHAVPIHQAIKRPKSPTNLKLLLAQILEEI